MSWHHATQPRRGARHDARSTHLNGQRSVPVAVRTQQHLPYIGVHVVGRHALLQTRAATITPGAKGHTLACTHMA